MTDTAPRDERASAQRHPGFVDVGRALVLKSIALVLEFGEHLPRPEAAHDLAVAAERRVARRRQRDIVHVAAALLLVLSVSAAVLAIPNESYEMLGAYGYLGVFLITLITTGALVLPVPYLALIFKSSMFLDPVGIALVAGVAAAIGELTGYLLGVSGRKLVGDSRWHRAVDHWMRRHGFLTIGVFAFIPNPAFDAAGIAAGALRYSVWRFALACFVGKTAKFLIVAALGAGS